MEAYIMQILRNIHSNQIIELAGEKNTVGVEFAVGPTTNRTFFDDGRNAVEVHRGPCKYTPRLVGTPV